MKPITNPKREIKKGEKLVEIYWIDAHRKDGWWNQKEINEWELNAGNVKQLGYVLKEDKEWLVIASAIGEDKTYLCTHRIPKGMIIKRRNLK